MSKKKEKGVTLMGKTFDVGRCLRGSDYADVLELLEKRVDKRGGGPADLAFLALAVAESCVALLLFHWSYEEDVDVGIAGLRESTYKLAQSADAGLRVSRC